MLVSDRVSVRQIVRELKRRKQKVQASEGSYDDDGTLSYATEEVISALLRRGMVEAVGPFSRRQQKVLEEWQGAGMVHWDEPEYRALDSVKWRALTTNLPILEYFSN
jgi:hypothetical protein